MVMKQHMALLLFAPNRLFTKSLFSPKLIPNVLSVDSCSHMNSERKSFTEIAEFSGEINVIVS